MLKIALPRSKIAPGTFKFILSLHFSEKISNLPPTPRTGGRVSFQSWEVGGGVGAIPWFLNWIILKIFEVICTPNFVCKLEWPFSNIFCKKYHENPCFYDFLRKNQFLPIFYAQNGHFSIFVGALILWRHPWLVLILVSMERGCPYLYTGSKFRAIWPSVLIIRRGLQQPP